MEVARLAPRMNQPSDTVVGMRTRLAAPVRASTLASELGLELSGDDRSIELVAPLDQPADNALVFCSRDRIEPPTHPISVIGGGHLEAPTLIVSESPRLDFARALQALDRISGFRRVSRPPEVHPTASIAEFVSLGRDVIVGPGTRIEPFVCIADDVVIGADCWIKSGAVIGQAGFGHERDEHGVPHRLLHLGGVVIRDRVEVGSLTTICQGTLAPTVVEDDAKIDDHVHIAHNCHIERSALVIACAEVSGGVRVGARSWVGPNVSIRDGLEVGADSTIGIGSNVVKSVPASTTVAGNPAREFGR